MKFVFKRFIRLYPAFWISLILGILLIPAVLRDQLAGVLFEFTGFYVILGSGSGIVNPMGWFIATIFCLYLLFPLFSRVVQRYGLSAILGLCIISWGLRWAVLTYNIIPLELFWRWFPLFNAFEFCLGIYIVQKKWYPTTVNVYPGVRKLADLSFYVFLFHVIVLREFFPLPAAILSPVIAFDRAISMGNVYFGYTLYYIEIMAAIVIVSWIAMEIDVRLQKWILEQNSVKRFLSGP
jgi:peptidoglycan/LPS O-acetylase OafA/YrhL